MKFDVSGKLYTDFELHELAIDTLERAEAAEAEAEALRGEHAKYLKSVEEDERADKDTIFKLREQLATVTRERDAALESIKAMRDNIAEIEQNRFRRALSPDWSTDDETPLGQSLDGLGDEVEP